MRHRQLALRIAIRTGFEDALGRLQTESSLGRHELPVRHPQREKRKQRRLLIHTALPT